jgi:hypothetical protein
MFSGRWESYAFRMAKELKKEVMEGVAEDP